MVSFTATSVAAFVDDIFAGSGQTYQGTEAAIRKSLKPRSFATGKIFTIKNRTEYHPEGLGYNLLAKVEGQDPVLKDEVIIIGGIWIMWAAVPT